MKAVLESTSKIVYLSADSTMAGAVPARVWEGTTERGHRIVAFVTRVTPMLEEGDEGYAESSAAFAAELQEVRAPSPDVEVFPMRLIL